MANLVENRKRSTPTLATGEVICNPESGRLATPVEHPYTEEIAIEIGNFRLWLSREEFLKLAFGMWSIQQLISALADDSEEDSQIDHQPGCQICGGSLDKDANGNYLPCPSTGPVHEEYIKRFLILQQPGKNKSDAIIPYTTLDKNILTTKKG